MRKILLLVLLLGAVTFNYFTFVQHEEAKQVSTSVNPSSPPSSTGSVSSKIPRATSFSTPENPAPELFISSNGQDKTYVVSLSELYSQNHLGEEKILPIPPQKDLASLKSYARELEKTTHIPTSLVLYFKDKPQTKSNRSILTKEVLVKVNNPKKILNYPPATRIETPSYAPDYRIVTLSESGQSIEASDELESLAGVTYATPLLATWKSRKSLPNDTLINQQWHLKNTGQSGGLIGIDSKVENVWGAFGGAGFRGSGIRIAIIDDGLETLHPDLNANVDTQNGYNWNATPDNINPNPVAADDNHGTACAGIAAAVGNNNLGVSGAAPQATLVGFRLIAAAFTDAEEADAFTRANAIIQIKSNSWGQGDDGDVIGGLGSLGQAALANAVVSGRSGKGTIFVFAGGNGRVEGDYSNFDSYCSSRFVIGVAALDNFGRQAYYSESGSNLLVTAPSGGDAGTLDITTTDRTSTAGYNTGSGLAGNYDSTFNGTSAATPLVSGVCALLLQKNPNLGWRDLKEVLLRSATKVTPADTDWFTNGAGFSFNHKFGAGLINAEAAANLITNWVNLRPETSTQLTDSTITNIPDNNATGITRSFNFTTSTLRVEHVEVTLTYTHQFRGDLECILTSPSGKKSVLAIPRSADNNAVTNESYTFTTVHHWGEKSNGTWQVQVADRGARDLGSLRGVTVKLLGTTYSTGIENWRFNSFTAAELSNPLISSNNADPDSDGATNLLEYALSTNPKITTSVPLPVLDLASGNLTLSYSKLRTDLTYVVETSTTLAANSWSTTGVNQGTGINPTASIAVGSDPKRFLRLRITSP